MVSSAKELALKQEASLLMHIQEQIKETEGLLMNLLHQRMKHDMEILCSIKGIGENTAMNFFIEMGGIEMYENDKKLIAASGLILQPTSRVNTRKKQDKQERKPTLTESDLAHGNKGYYQQQPLQGLFL